MGRNNYLFTEKSLRVIFPVIIVAAMVALLALNWYINGSNQIYTTLRERYSKFKGCFKAETDGQDPKTVAK